MAEEAQVQKEVVKDEHVKRLRHEEKGDKAAGKPDFAKATSGKAGVGEPSFAMTSDFAKASPDKSAGEGDGFPDFYHDAKTLLSWHAPGRPFRNHSKEYFINLFLITTAIEIIIFLFHMYLLMMVVFSLAFLAFALAIITPHTFFYKITTEGIRIEDNFFIWEELYDFYFSKHDGIDVVKIGTKAFIPGELTLMLGDITPRQVKAALITFLPYREYVKPTFTQKAGDWLEKNFPLEKTSH